MVSPIVVIGKERNKQYTRIKDENCNKGCKSPLKSACIRTAPVAVRKTSVMMVKGLVVSGRIRTGPLIKVACNFLNAVLHAMV